MLSQYLRTLALRSLSHSRDCFDLKAAERFRLLADDLLSKASELEGNEASVSNSLAVTEEKGQLSSGTDGESGHER